MEEYGKTRYIPKSEREKQKKELPSMRKMAASCETCQFFDYDEEYEENRCMMSLDEDEMVRVSYMGARECPYYKYYDEYKSVHKQI